MPDAILFAGPTTFGLPRGLADAAGVELRPPVRRGDVARLVEDAPAGNLVICDGVFQVAPAIGHAELCQALDRGWRVWGVSSIGAIRAWELRGEGMQGFGEVFGMFARFDDFTDDELCLLHFPEPPWFPVSEALVNVRHALGCLGPELGIGDAAAQAVIDDLRGRWFGDRTPDRIGAALRRGAGCDDRQVDRLLNWLSSNRLKTQDLAALLHRRPWSDDASPPAAGP